MEKITEGHKEFEVEACVLARSLRSRKKRETPDALSNNDGVCRSAGEVASAVTTAYLLAVERRREKITKGHQEFQAEASVLGRIRQPNLLALRAYYLGPKGEKLLVFDCMT